MQKEQDEEEDEQMMRKPKQVEVPPSDRVNGRREHEHDNQHQHVACERIRTCAETMIAMHKM